MPAETALVKCVPGQYTLLADDKENVSFQIRSQTTSQDGKDVTIHGSPKARFVIAQSLPSPLAENYWTFDSSEPKSLGNMAGVKIYAMPEDKNTTLNIAVLRG